ncbi:MAG: S49 family peptidase, partial [Candidatus Bathyarchaeia archaeon]
MNETNQKIDWAETLQSMLGRREVLVTVLICILAGSGLVYLHYTRYFKLRKDVIGIINIEGYIETAETVSRYTDIINQAMLNESVKAVVLVVDSGGGYADYVERIYLDLLELKEKKPLVSSIIMALSGGYYIAVATDYIYVHPTSFVGNIGVLGTGPPVLIPSESVLETGAYKVTGFSRLLFSHNLSHALDNFASAVEMGRVNASRPLKLSSTQLRRGMIYLGSEALDVGLADEIGSLQKALENVAQKAGLVEYEVVELSPREVNGYKSWWGSSNHTSVESRNMTLETLNRLHPPPAVHYIYLPPQATTQASFARESFTAQATGSGQVLVDVSHGNQISWWDLDILIAELAKRNVTASFVSKWDDLDSKLSNASCLIVASPTEVYTDEECSRIEKFVEEGRLLVMFFDPAWEHIGEQGVSQGIIAPINSLSVRFGLSFAKGYLYNEAEHFGIYRNIYVRNFTGSPLTKNLRSLVLFTATHIYSMGKGIVWTANETYSSAAERADSYATTVLMESVNGTVAAFGDLTFLREPYCYVEDNYELILNLVSLITGVQVPVEEVEEGVEEEVAKSYLPVGTEKNYTEWVDDEESLVRWFKVSETEIKIERPNQTTNYYLTEDDALWRWVSNGMEC